MELRDYQEKAIDVIWNDLIDETEVLLEAAAGSGKTVIIAELIRRFMTNYPGMRILVMAHRQELVIQAFHKLLRIWPDGVESIGLACGATGPVDMNKEVVIGSVQTLCRRKLEEVISLLIVDECHHIPNLEAGGQYHKVISRLKESNPELRTLGVTATPFRLGHGYIYGAESLKGKRNFFPRLNHKISMDELIKEGFLVPVRAKEAFPMEKALSKIHIKNGDYDIEELSILCGKENCLKAALDAYINRGEGRKKALIFAVSIDHANKLKEVFLKAGILAGAVSSDSSDEERLRVLGEFNKGNLNVLVNVAILTEGWDSPKVDLILICRPTKAPALFVQMVGRGMRTYDGKKDILILDLADNFKTHGSPSSPMVSAGGKKRLRRSSLDYKTCPQCQEFVIRNQPSCPICGFEFQKTLFQIYDHEPQGFLVSDEGKDAEEIKTHEIPAPESPVKIVLSEDLKKIPAEENHEEITDEKIIFEESAEEESAEEEITEEVQEEKNIVHSFTILRTQTLKGNFMAVLLVNCHPGGCVKIWLDIEGNSSQKGRYYAQIFWEKMSGGKTPPQTIKEAVERVKELNIPREITLIVENGYKKIKEFSLY